MLLENAFKLKKNKEKTKERTYIEGRRSPRNRS